jgi:ATP-dependent Zn protease
MKPFLNIEKLRFVIFFFYFSLVSFSSFSKIERGASDNNDNVDNSIIIARIGNDDIEISIPSIVFSFSDVDVKVKFKNSEHTRLLFNNNKIVFIINGEERQLNFINGEASFTKRFDKENILNIYVEGFSYSHRIKIITLLMILLPIILTIVLVIFLMIKRN